jgi:hypothetical protein
MNTYRITYYTMSDGENTVILEAGTPAEAEASARQRDDLFAQLKQIIYIGEKPMTTTPDRITAQEIRELFKEQNARLIDLHFEIELLRDSIAHMKEGLQQAATPPASQVGTFGGMTIDIIVMSYDDNGKPTYKAQGQPYPKHGVRIWEEVLPLLGVNPATLHPGKNPQTPAIQARVLLGETTNQDTGAKQTGPRKVTGKA